MPNNTCRRGVTLIEMLVASSVLFTLIALMMPAMQKVRVAAARVACQSNLRQVGLATLHYESVQMDLRTPRKTARHARHEPVKLVKVDGPCNGVCFTATPVPRDPPVRKE